jgi:hypothetical protein
VDCAAAGPAGKNGAKDGAVQKNGGGAPRLAVRKRVLLSLRGDYAGIIRLLEMIRARVDRVRVGELTMELVSPEGAELNAGFVLTLYTLDRGDEEEA